MQKISKNYNQSYAIIWTLFSFISIVNHTNLAKFTLKHKTNLLGPPHLKIIGICYYPDVLKEAKKKHKYWPLTKFLWKSILSNKQNIGYDVILIETFIFELKRIWWDFSVMRIRYKLTKKRTKTEKYKTFLTKKNIIKFESIRYKQNALRNMFFSLKFFSLKLEGFETFQRFTKT